MSQMWLRGALWFSLLSGVLVGLGGCSKDDSNEQAKGKASNAVTNKADDSETWWCKEHGMLEDICAQCNAKVTAEMKKKGDWCKEHDRPKSQCFICDPTLKEKFAAQYRAKYGKEPPPTEEESKKDESKPEDLKKEPQK
jgi:hypothetical protein